MQIEYTVFVSVRACKYPNTGFVIPSAQIPKLGLP